MKIDFKKLIALCSLVAGSLGFVFGHELAALGLAIPAAALVVDLAVEIDPDLARGFGRSNVRVRSSGRGGGFR